MQVKIKKLHPRAHVPGYQSAHAAGMDLHALLEHPLLLEPGQRFLVPTGFALELPDGFEAQVRPRSGLAIKQGLTLANSPGTIDADYRGEIRVIVINLGQEAVRIADGDRIAQMIIAPVSRAEIFVVDELNETGRSVGGFGSTGVSSS